MSDLRLDTYRVFVDAGPPPSEPYRLPLPTTPGTWVEVPRLVEVRAQVEIEYGAGASWREVRVAWDGPFGEVVTVPRHVLVWDEQGETVYGVTRFDAEIAEYWRVWLWRYELVGDTRVAAMGD